MDASESKKQRSTEVATTDPLTVGSIIYGVRKHSGSGYDSLVAFYARKEAADKNAKKRGRGHGDYSHYSYHHTVEEITLL